MCKFILAFLLLALTATALQAQSPASENPTDYRQLWRRGQYEQAVDALRGYLEENRGNNRSFSTYIDYAELLTRIGEHDEAIDLLEKITAAYPLPSFSLRLAHLYRYRGRLAEYRDLLAGVTRQVETLRGYRLDREEELALIQLRSMHGEDPQTALADYQRLADAHPNFTDARIAAAELAAQRRAFDIAAAFYAGALHIDPENQQALAGLADARHQSGDGRYRNTLDELLSLNPHHPRGLALQASAALDLGQSDMALARLDEILAVNANDLHALALKAAALFLTDRYDEAQAVRDRGLAFNPHAAEIFRVSGRVASRHYRFAEGRAFQEQALAIDPQDQQARLLLALDLLRLGADREARGELEKVFAADPYNVQAYNLLSVSDAIAGFDILHRGKLVVQLPEFEAKIIGGEMLDLLAEAADHYQQLYSIELADTVLVQVFAEHDEFMVRSVGLPGSVGHLGICFGKVVTMDSPRARGEGQMNWRQVLWHEFVHVITLQKTHNRIPRWLSEGISVYEETRKDSAWGQHLDPDFKTVLAAGLPQVADLDDYFNQPASQNHLLFGYYAAGEFARFYTETYGRESLVRTLDAIALGTPATQALATAAGQTPAEMDQRFFQYLSIRVAPLAQLPDSSGAKTPFTLALKRGDEAALMGDLSAAEAAYNSAYELFPDYRADDAPLRRLSRLYADTDDREARISALERVVAWDGDAHAAALALAALYARDQHWPEAITALDRAGDVIPFRPTLLADRARYLQTAGDLDRAADDLRKLVYLDSTRQTQHRLALARVLQAQGDKQTAKRELLTLLERTPRFWDAQSLLLELLAEEP